MRMSISTKDAIVRKPKHNFYNAFIISREYRKKFEKYWRHYSHTYRIWWRYDIIKKICYSSRHYILIEKSHAINFCFVWAKSSQKGISHRFTDRKLKDRHNLYAVLNRVGIMPNKWYKNSFSKWMNKQCIHSMPFLPLNLVQKNCIKLMSL